MTLVHVRDRVWSLCEKIVSACGAAATDSVFIVRYLGMGVISTILNFGIFILATELGNVWYVYASILAFLTRSAVKFLLIRTWLFGTRIPGHPLLHLAQFVALEAIGLGLSVLFLALFVELLSLVPIVGLVATSAIASVISLILTRYLFKPVPYPQGSS